jgi:eukaryotic-like serine/threonine-protein kinase
MGLTSAQMARMSRLLDEALPLDEVGRRAWLDTLASEHQDIAPALREALSPYTANTHDPLLTLPKVGSDDESVSATASELKPGSRVGPYELIKPLGAGGMAEVWLARRADGVFKREVALKLPMLTRLRKDLEQRFARERDILASLEHPNIARLYDGGADSNGLPYLAMEYVAGEPITDWCDAHKLAIPERLRLLLQVLDGMQYAHERHVIHRDLKPSNILVTESGQVRLLDFGIAKLLQTEEADRTQLTSLYGRALTPAYASPELLRGDTVDARSDVYSLGVLIYELLTGARPYRLKAGASLGTLEQAIATVEVSKPSTQIEPQSCEARAVTQEKLVRLLRGDLDVIVLKALDKEPDQRYASSAAMAEDLRRHLRSEVIQAQPPRLPYRLRKFVRRRRTGVVVAAFVAAIVVAAGGYEMYRTATEPAREIAALPAAKPLGDKSIAVLPFLDLSEKKDQEYFSDGLSEELIDLLAQMQGLKVIARTSSFYFKGKPITIAQIAKALGVSNVLEGSVRKSGNTLRVTAQLIRADSGAHLWSQSFDRDVTDIIKVQDEIAAAVVKALKLSLLQGAPQSTGTHDEKAYALYLQARYFADRSWNTENELKAVGLLQQAVALDAGFARAWAALAGRYAQEALHGAGSHDEKRRLAESSAEKALAIDPGLSESHIAKARISYYLDWDWKAADTEISRARALDPASADGIYWAANIADVFGHFDDALQLRQQAVSIDPLSPTQHFWLGRSYLKLGRLADAESSFRTSLDLNPNGPVLHWNIALTLMLRGEYRAALEEMQRETSAPARTVGLALIYGAMGRAVEAEKALREMSELKDPGVSPFWFAVVHACRGEKDQAFSSLGRAYEAHDFYLIDIRGFPLLKNLESDPRYDALLRKMNFTL